MRDPIIFETVERFTQMVKSCTNAAGVVSVADDGFCWDADTRSLSESETDGHFREISFDGEGLRVLFAYPKKLTKDLFLSLCQQFSEGTLEETEQEWVWRSTTATAEITCHHDIRFGCREGNLPYLSFWFKSAGDIETAQQHLERLANYLQ